MSLTSAEAQAVNVLLTAVHGPPSIRDGLPTRDQVRDASITLAASARARLRGGFRPDQIPDVPTSRRGDLAVGVEWEAADGA